MAVGGLCLDERTRQQSKRQSVSFEALSCLFNCNEALRLWGLTIGLDLETRGFDEILEWVTYGSAAMGAAAEFHT